MARMISFHATSPHLASDGANARRHATAAFDLANEVQHKRTATFRDAALCAEVALSVVRIFAILAGRRERINLEYERCDVEDLPWGLGTPFCDDVRPGTAARVTVAVRSVEARHEVDVSRLREWLGSNGKSPREQALKHELRKLLGWDAN